MLYPRIQQITGNPSTTHIWPSPVRVNKKIHMVAFNPKFRCPLCERFHALRQCSRFITLPVEEKLRVVTHKALCFNCLAQSHSRAACRSIDRCRRCLQNHNSWLHPMPEGRVWVKMTAMVRVRARPSSEIVWTRVLLDPTVARSSMTHEEARDLECIVAQGRTRITIFRQDEEEKKFEVEMAVDDRLYGRSPRASVESEYLAIGDMTLADKHWNQSRAYHLILGADVAGRVFIGPAKGKPGAIFFQDTVFGFACFGEGVALKA